MKYSISNSLFRKSLFGGNHQKVKKSATKQITQRKIWWNTKTFAPEAGVAVRVVVCTTIVVERLVVGVVLVGDGAKEEEDKVEVEVSIGMKICVKLRREPAVAFGFGLSLRIWQTIW